MKAIAVATDAPETLPAVRTTVDEKAGPDIALDSDGAVMARLNPRGATPFSIFAARGGVKLYEHEGYKPGDLPKYEATLTQSSLQKGPPASKKANGPIRLPIHSTQLLEYYRWFEDQDGFAVTIDRLNLLTSYISPDASLTSWVRLDSIVYNNPPSAERFETQVIPERLQLNYEDKSWNLTGGDFYRQLGRGLLISAQRRRSRD